jgi:hypothetical protein
MQADSSPNGNEHRKNRCQTAQPAPPRGVICTDPRMTHLGGNTFLCPEMEVLNPPEPIKHPRKPKQQGS